MSICQWFEFFQLTIVMLKICLLQILHMLTIDCHCTLRRAKMPFVLRSFCRLSIYEVRVVSLCLKTFTSLLDPSCRFNFCCLTFLLSIENMLIYKLFFMLLFVFFYCLILTIPWFLLLSSFMLLTPILFKLRKTLNSPLFLR